MRAYRICGYPYLEEEINYLGNAFSSLGYSHQFIEKIHKQVRSKFFNGDRVEREEVEYQPTMVVPYNSFSENYVKPLFRSQNMRVAYHANNTLRSKLIRNRPTMGDPNNRPGVHYIKCGECDLGYVGETGRSFQVRLREHRDDIRLGRERNAIFKHVSNTNHHIDWTSAKTLYHHSSKFERLVVESSLIKLFQISTTWLVR